MARFRPVSKVVNTIKQRRNAFSGSHNALQRRDSRLIVMAYSMQQLLVTNSSIFPTPPISTGLMGGQINDHRNNMQILNFKGNRGSHNAKIANDATRNILQNTVTANAAYVVATGNALFPSNNFAERVAVILLGGSPIRNKGKNNLPIINRNEASKNSRRPPAPRAIKIILPIHPNPGYAQIRWQASKGATSYEVFNSDPTTGLPTTLFQVTPSSSLSVGIATSGTQFQFRIRANGPNQTSSGFSNPFRFHIP